jgi:opacity protein-like surface antigen
VSHLGEFEVGYTQKKESVPLTVGTLSGRINIKGDITPLMLNYRAEISGSEMFGGYIGAGGGMAHVSVSGSGLGVSVSDSDNAFAWQAFAGLTYKPSPAVSIHAGVRYIKINDVTMQGITAEVGDDTALEAGVSFKF